MRPIFLIISSTLLFACLTSPSGLSQIDQLLQCLDGTYIGESVNSVGESSPMQDMRRVIDAPAIGSHVVYWEVRTGNEQKLYRQRLLTYTTDEVTSEIIQRTWRLNDGLSWPDQISDEFFLTLSIDDINSQLGELCVNKWQKQDQVWRSYLNPDNCRIWSDKRKKFRRIEGESILTNKHLKQAERGFSDDGSKQEFGTPQGEFHTLIRQ